MFVCVMVNLADKIIFTCDFLQNGSFLKTPSSLEMLHPHAWKGISGVGVVCNWAALEKDQLWVHA